MTVLDQVPVRWRHDRLVRSDAPRLGGARVLTAGDSWVAVTDGSHGTSVVGYGDGGGAARLVTALVAAGELRPPLHWLSLPRDVDVPAEVAAALQVEPLPGWDWLSVDALPPVLPRESQVVRLDLGIEAPAIRECLEEANPGTDADPDGAHEIAWWGVRGPRGGLLGVIGASERGGGHPGEQTWHLHGLGVRPGARRQGLGAALTAAAVRDGLGQGLPWVSLGVWAHNEPALAMYAALGFRTDHRRRSYRPRGQAGTHPHR
ncbi:GNAT family N-acetyltransferase [Cellulomonas sp. NTE-D12]|uniref:GNAT family N-acetyltransferase n=1 Tax=Cellulomonas sp. NTE-D12 TaxID=2962632 RepID=UPI003081CD67|nr:hypothetical protein CELD12_18040 [Cellulomonas sp. NTE-D12]